MTDTRTKPPARRKSGAAAALGAALVLSGCSWMTGGSDACGSERLDGYVGRSVEDLPQLSGVTRVIRPDMAVTQDYWATRLNIDVDADGDITRVWCG